MKISAVCVAVATGLVAVGVTGCGGSVQTMPRKAAHLTIGSTTHAASPAKCKRDQQYQTIDIRDGDGRVEAVMVLSGERVTPQWVKIRNVDGFNGSVWQDGVGQAHVDLAQDNYTITGSAYGIAKSNPDKVVTTDFKITAQC